VYKPGGDPVTGFSQGILKLIGEYMGFLGTGEKLPADYIYPVLVWLGRPNREVGCGLDSKLGVAFGREVGCRSNRRIGSLGGLALSSQLGGSLGIKRGYRKG